MTLRYTRAPVLTTLVFIIAACGSPAATGLESTTPSEGPPGAENTKITDWTDPRPSDWADKYPNFAPVTTFGDGSLKRVQDAGKILLCSSLGLNPWAYIDPATNEIVGIEPDFLTFILDEIGVAEAEYVNVEFQALIPALEGGQCDAVLGMGIRADRAEQVKFVVPYVFVYDQFAVAEDSAFQSADDMKGKRIGTFAGSADEDVLTAWIKDQGVEAEVLYFTTPNECFLATVNGTIDACFTDNFAISAALQGEYSTLRVLPEPFSYAAGFPDDAASNPYKLLSVGINTGFEDEDLNLALSIATQKMIEDGHQRQVLEKWHLWDENQTDMIREDA